MCHLTPIFKNYFFVLRHLQIRGVCNLQLSRNKCHFQYSGSSSTPKLSYLLELVNGSSCIPKLSHLLELNERIRVHNSLRVVCEIVKGLLWFTIFNCVLSHSANQYIARMKRSCTCLNYQPLIGETPFLKLYSAVWFLWLADSLTYRKSKNEGINLIHFKEKYNITSNDTGGKIIVLV